MAHILIVDDDHDILRLMEFSLKKAGHEVTVASAGAQGLEVVSNTTLNLIIADIMMPQMTGYEFTRRVRKMPGMEELPIIIYSARFQPVDQQAALDAGATEYMPKTLTPSEIVQQVGQILGEETADPQTPQTPALAFFSLRGGTGVTSLAINTAVALAFGHKTPVTLTDLNLFAGHAGIMLNLRPKKHLQDLLNSQTPASIDVIKQHLTGHSSGVQLLASPLLPSETSTSNKLEAVIRSLRAQFKFNVLDFPHIPNSAVLKLLSEITKLALVLSSDVPSLQSAAAGIQLLTQHGLKIEKIMPVLNHNSSAPGLSKEIIQKTLHIPLAAEIPFEANFMSAINNGHPLVLQNPSSPASLAIARLALALIK